MSKKHDSVSPMIDDWLRERPDLDPAPLEILARVNRLSAMLIKRSERWLEPLGLTWESFSLIVTLRRVGAPYELRPGEILAGSLLTSGAITNRIDRVEQQGLVKRLRDPNDRRGVVVRLTPAGRKLADQSIAMHFERLRPLMSTLNKTEFKAAGALLEKLLVGLEDPAAQPEPAPASRGKPPPRATQSP